MLGFIGPWVKSLIIIVLLGNLAELVLPKGDMKRYAGLVVGLVLLLTMISPVWSLMQGMRQTAMGAWNTNGSTQGASFQRLVAREELNQAQAMILAYHGVSACHLSQGAGGPLMVDVTVDRAVSQSALTKYISGALQITSGRKPTFTVVVHRIR